MLYNPLDQVNKQKELVRDNVTRMYAPQQDIDLGRIKKSEDENELIKGGEGSKGGKIIGHTKSGKAIYDTAVHPSHSNFTSTDHSDEAQVHRDKMAAHNANGEGHLYHLSMGNRDTHKALSEKQTSNADLSSTIGKTQSGKDIYANHDHAGHKDFSKEDHDDAVKTHMDHYKSKGEPLPFDDDEDHITNAVRHKQESNKKSAEKKGDTSTDGSSVIGKTTSGKDIRNFPDHPEHKDFSADDHIDAFYAQKKVHDKTKDEVFAKYGGKSTKESRAELDNHVEHGMASERMQKHLDHYGKLKGIKKS